MKKLYFLFPACGLLVKEKKGNIGLGLLSFRQVIEERREERKQKGGNCTNVSRGDQKKVDSGKREKMLMENSAK